ncbi:TetR/AcrR family transcriptional regulator [Paraferrimonas sedimenticola]|uniref:TetR family transcriptional regulator n=1 Tax=Paraferrimonas sedimenticola TaxID=375674 RepID=A0AA37RZD2_9GAMM|nr:TetR/AcrR family transcriptional regulator [Paraferrimonas sedimenticola]GLP97996.1 TetR family transcriptional regulator [Paraferrimonas sedimenticola]
MAAGRHRAFDAEESLQKALQVFWSKGYSGTSLSDLIAAMGINKPSLYAAFGNKEALFVSAINQYVNEYGSPHALHLQTEGASLQARLVAFLDSVIGSIADSELPLGCFVVNSTCESGSSCLPAEAAKAVTEINSASIASFSQFFADEIDKQNLSSDKKPETLAHYLLTQQFGLAVMARNGASQEQLKQIAREAVEGMLA